MKKLLFIFTALAVLLASCTSELDPGRVLAPDGRVVPEGYALVNFEVNVPAGRPHTKVFSDNPVISSLHVAVFDQNHYLEDYVLATSKGPVSSSVDGSYPNVNYDSENSSATTWNYQVVLPTSNEYRIIHFIANGPDTLPFGTEVEVIGNLTTSGGQDAYWQRIELTKGIVADGSGNLNTTTTNQLKGIKLVRNFSKISVTSSPKTTSNFELLYAYVFNDASAGTVAPYCTATRDFIEDYQNYNSDELRANFNYQAWMPEDYTLDETVPADVAVDASQWIAPDPLNDNYATTYLYEREMPIENPVIVLIYGNYYPDVAGHPDTYTPYYYKVDLKDTDDEYFPILRNFNYKINIRKVSTPGRPSVQEAIEMPGSGNVSTAIENEELTNISDGVSRIAVSFTDTTIVSGSAFDLKYKFIPDFQNAPESSDNVVVATSDNVTHQRVTVTTEPDDGASGMFSFTVDADMSSPDAEGYSTIHIDPVEPGSLTRTQKLSIKGVAIDGTIISRDITIVLRQKMPLNLYCTPSEIKKETGTEFDLVLQVPGGLSKMIFPLEIKIESEGLTIVPAKGDNLPVESGKSIVLANPSDPEDGTTTGKPAFYFIKTISWADYCDAELELDGTKHIVCHFKSNCAESATNIWAANRYFYTGYTHLSNYDPKSFQNLQFATGADFAVGHNANATFSFASVADFNSLNGGPITVTLVGLEPSETDTALTPVAPSADIPGGYQYSFTPTTAGTNTLNLASSTATGPWGVYLDADKFIRSELRRTRRVTISGSALTYTNNTSNTDLFGTRFNSDDYNGGVYVREDEYSSDMSSAPYTGVTRGGNNNNRNFHNNSTSVSFDVDVTADKLYFLFNLSGTIYSGTLDITPGTNDLTINSGTVYFSPRKTQGVIDADNVSLIVTQTANVNITRNTNTGSTVTYVSADPTIASVTSAGVISGLRAGITTITVSVPETATHSAAEKTITVTVLRPSVYVTLTDQTTTTTKSNLQMTNIGSQKIYLRAAIVAAWYDSTGNIVAVWDESQGTFSGLAPSGWTKVDDVYYYDAGINSNASPAAPLFSTYTKPAAPVDGSHLEMTIMVQAIPFDSSKTCVEAFAALN